jgi:hypothetical protein
MKQTILAVIFSIFVVSCETKNATVSDTDIKIAGNTLKAYEIDGCEYIGIDLGSKYGFLTHKGNCKSCREFLLNSLKQNKPNQ